jgi:uncharacterized membrane protein SpoIIM required for sporulation
MNLTSFLEQRAPDWAELDRLVADAGRRPERLGPDGVRRLGVLYRAAAADLAQARRRYRGDPVVAQLADRVGRARHLVYDVEPRRVSLVHFLTRGYWQRIRERPFMLLFAALLVFVPAALAVLWAHHDPAGAVGALPGQFQRVRPGAAPKSGSLGLSTAEQSFFASSIFTNNIKVTFQAFAGGIAVGLVTMFVLLQNGVMLGVIAGLSFDAGAGKPFLELVVPHGVLEMSGIVVAGAAGLRLGWAVVSPGRRRRGEAVVDEARRTVEIVLGTALWLVVAGLVEGFITPRGLGLGPVVVIGLGLGAVYWTLVVVAGRPSSQPGASFGP